MCFEISADGKNFFSATAMLKGKKVIVHSDEVPAPKFIRMGWSDTAIPNLEDKNGWPVPIFAAREIK